MVALGKNTGRKGIGETFTFTVVFIGGIYMCDCDYKLDKRICLDKYVSKSTK